MAQLKSFYDLMNELSMKTDKNLKNLKMPVKGPKGTSKHMRMKVATHDAPGAGDIKKAVNSSVQSVDRKPEKYLKPDGKPGIRMVKVDKEVIKKEASVLKPTKPSDITKHARTLAKSSDDYERNKKKYIDKARSKVFKMYPKESLNGLMKEATHKTDSFIGHSHAKKAGMKVVKHSSGVTGDNVTISHPDPKKLQKYVDNHLGGGKIKEATWPDEMPPTNEDKYTYFDTKDDAHAHAKKHGGKVYTNSGKGATKVKGKPVNTHVVIKDDVDEALSMMQRIKKSRTMKRMKARIAIGRRRAAKKMANKKTLEKRSRRQARNELAKKLTRGIPKSELTPARKREIEKRLEKPALQQRINRLAKRKFKDVRKKEVARKKG